MDMILQTASEDTTLWPWIVIILLFVIAINTSDGGVPHNHYSKNRNSRRYGSGYSAKNGIPEGTKIRPPKGARPAGVVLKKDVKEHKEKE